MQIKYDDDMMLAGVIYIYIRLFVTKTDRIQY